MELETALIIVPPRPVQSFAYPIRETHDAESFNRVPAHITLIYPFVPPDEVEEAEKALTKTCKKFPAFELTLDRYGQFETALFLEPSQPQKVLDLFELISAAFPDYPPYEGKKGEGLHPHLTLAQFKKPTQAEKIKLPPEPKFTFEVKQVHIYLGPTDDDTPFIPRSVIPLGK
jgi:2'-5' RNA ligase